MHKPLFNPTTGEILIEKYVSEMPSFQKIMEDNLVEPHEIAEQNARVIKLLHRLENTVSDDVQDMITELLCELAVLGSIQSIYFKQSQK
ncbi:MAG: hypothetical protein ACTSWD_14210 [Candidatus Heimdallarchaeota archaeon]